MNFISALKGDRPDRIPVWFMRQAGRYLPQYHELRKNRSIKEICMDPRAVSDITYSPVELLGVDAAIIFSDILLPLESMGFDLEYRAGVGPVLSEFKGASAAESFSIKHFRYPLSESIGLFKDEHPDVPLIGFTAGPITLSSYMIAGKSDRDLSATKRHAMKDPQDFIMLIDRSVDAIISMARYQKAAGADVIQIFDSWAGALSPVQFNRIYRGFLEEIRSELDFPLIYFSTGTGGIVEDLATIGFDFLSLDWRMRLSDVRKRIGDSTGLQGNLDPEAAGSSPQIALQETRDILEGMKGKENYIFNLGHGVLPHTDPETLKKIVEEVHNYDR